MITEKTGAPFSQPTLKPTSTSLKIGDKRPRAAENSSEDEPINKDPSLGRKSQIPQQPPVKRYKIFELHPDNATEQSELARGQVSPIGSNMRHGSGPRPSPRSVSPTLNENETELRCNLTTEINVQRLKGRNLNSACFRNIMKLLKKAKSERPSGETAASRLRYEWLEEDDLSEVAAHRIEKGGTCSRALLTRFENFVYGPLMSTEEKRTQERVICVEECLSSAQVSPTSNQKKLFLHRLENVILDPLAYGLDEKHARIGFLHNQLRTAMSANSKLSRSTCREFAEFFDPKGEIINASVDSAVARTETPSSTRKVPSMSLPPTPSKTTKKHAKDPSSPPLISSNPHPKSPSSSLTFATSAESNVCDLTDDTMASPFMIPKGKKKPSVSGSHLVQSDDALPRTAVQRAPKRHVVSGGQLASLEDTNAEAPMSVAPGTRCFNPNAPVATASMCATSSSHQLNSEVPKKLLDIFIAKQAPMLSILDLKKLKNAFVLAVNRGHLNPSAIDPTIGLCIAIACHLTRKKDLWQPCKWYDGAMSNIALSQESQPSLQSFHRQILQVHYLHMVGRLESAWEIISIAFGRAQILQMQNHHGGCLAVDKSSLQQIRLVWQFLWTKKVSLAIQLGIFDQSLEATHDSPMPMRSHIEGNMGAELSPADPQHLATSAFFVACASLYNYVDDILTVEHELRLTRIECPMKWLSVVDLSSFQELNRNLSSWNKGLPGFLEWKESSIDLAMEKNPIIRHMCLLTHLRYIYFRLRQYRPFFILALRLSHACQCELAPHAPGKNLDSVNADPLLALIHFNAMKCITAAQDIVKTLSASFAKENDDNVKFEHLDYIYAAALVLIGALGIAQQVANGETTRSATTMVEQFRRAENLLRNYEECCELAPKLKERIGRCRSNLDLLQCQSDPGSVKRARIVSDDAIRFSPEVWFKIYDRIGVDFSVERASEQGKCASSVVPGRRMTFGWLESLPFDMNSGR